MWRINLRDRERERENRGECFTESERGDHFKKKQF